MTNNNLSKRDRAEKAFKCAFAPIQTFLAAFLSLTRIRPLLDHFDSITNHTHK